ncbi:hypothetical protein [Streptomyces sp. AA1529]|uniref:hypothetical protein n=1 Tax=Streptomyces sp. AA1529 TaxID=1203257 RepID=UPI003D70F8E6
MQMMTKRGIQWLTAAADDPAGCSAAWAIDPRQPYLMSTGRHFAVVAINQRIGLTLRPTRSPQNAPGTSHG